MLSKSCSVVKKDRSRYRRNAVVARARSRPRPPRPRIPRRASTWPHPRGPINSCPAYISIIKRFIISLYHYDHLYIFYISNTFCRFAIFFVCDRSSLRVFWCGGIIFINFWPPFIFILSVESFDLMFLVVIWKKKKNKKLPCWNVHNLIFQNDYYYFILLQF